MAKCIQRNLYTSVCVFMPVLLLMLYVHAEYILFPTSCIPQVYTNTFSLFNLGVCKLLFVIKYHVIVGSYSTVGEMVTL